MLKHLLAAFCCCLALLASSPAGAQSQPATLPRPPAVARPNPYAPASLSRADTARAIRKLFRSRRGGGVGWLAFGTASILASTLPAQQSTSAGVWTPGVVAGSAFLLVGLNKRIQFRPGRERRVLRELAATGRLPHSVVRRLRGRFEPQHGVASDYNPLLAPGIAPPQQTALLTPAQVQEIAHADTLRAIARLYERHRRRGKLWAYSSVGSIGAMARVVTSPNYHSGSGDATGLALVAGIGIGLPVAFGIVNLAAYSEKHEEAVERQYRAGQPLPKKVRRHLKKKDLQPLD